MHCFCHDPDIHYGFMMFILLHLWLWTRMSDCWDLASLASSFQFFSFLWSDTLLCSWNRSVKSGSVTIPRNSSSVFGFVYTTIIIVQSWTHGMKCMETEMLAFISFLSIDYLSSLFRVCYRTLYHAVIYSLEGCIVCKRWQCIHIPCLTPIVDLLDCL